MKSRQWVIPSECVLRERKGKDPAVRSSRTQVDRMRETQKRLRGEVACGPEEPESGVGTGVRRKRFPQGGLLSLVSAAVGPSDES